MIGLRLAIAVALPAAVLAVSMTVTICGWDGLWPEYFRSVHACAVTDPPSEVFSSFMILGAFLGLTVSLLFVSWRWVVKWCARRRKTITRRRCAERQNP